MRSIPNRLDAAFTHAQSVYRQFHFGLSVEDRAAYTLSVLGGRSLAVFERMLRRPGASTAKVDEFMSALYEAQRTRRTR